MIKKNNILFVVTSFFIICFTNQSAFAIKATKCNGGGEYDYCGFGHHCKPCPANGYCPARANAGDVACTGWTGLKIEGGQLKSNTNHTESDGSFGIYVCPTNFPTSASGSKTVADCYTTVGGKKVYNKQITLNPGYYLPVNSSEVAECKTDSRYYCPGGTTVSPSFSYNQGIKECPSSKQANSAHTACVSPGIYLNPGYYLPINSATPAQCKNDSRYYCPGGLTVSFSTYQEQGIKECPSSKQANSAHTACEKSETTTVSVAPGKYLPANSTTAKECPNYATKYCPGGSFSQSSQDQGLYNCPTGGRTNSTKTGCNITISKEQLKYGFTKGSVECWTLTDPEAYKTCIYGNTTIVARYY